MDTSILSCKANSKMLDAHLVLFLVLFAKFCLFPMESFVYFIGIFYLYFLVCPYILLHCLSCWKVLPVCLLQKLFPCFIGKFCQSVFSGVSLKFGYNHGAETQIGKIFFFCSICATVTRLLYDQGSEFISELTGHWIPVSGTSDVFLV